MKRHNRIVINLLINLIEGVALLILIADLLYLYFKGVWYDPNMAIEVTELAFLWVLIPFTIWKAYKHVRKAFHYTRRGGGGP